MNIEILVYFKDVANSSDHHLKTEMKLISDGEVIVQENCGLTRTARDCIFKLWDRIEEMGINEEIEIITYHITNGIKRFYFKETHLAE